MRLYEGVAREFVEDTVQQRITRKLSEAFFDYYRYRPSDSEQRSWRNSLQHMSGMLQHAKLLGQGVVLEYQLPLTSKRLDCMLTGVHREEKTPHAVIVELKQWERTEATETEDCVVTYIGGRMRPILHPSRQVGQYREYLHDTHDTFHRGDVGLSACAYLHNMGENDTDEIFAPRHETLLKAFPVFRGDQTMALEQYLQHRIGGGRGMEVLAKINAGQYRPSRKLLDHTGDVIRDQGSYVLLDEQLVVFNEILSRVERASRGTGKKTVVLVRGGPGTGKSIIALHLVGRLAKQGRNAHFATGSRAFTEHMRKVVGSRAAAQFKRFVDYATVPPDTLDVVICDEAHRIWDKPKGQFLPKEARTGRPLVDHVIESAKVSVFFIDDHQVVRPDEVGNSSLVIASAKRLGVELCEFDLDAQFRCSGSDGFVRWVENTLEIERTANVLLDPKERFEFGVVSSPAELERRIREKVAGGATGRIMAGYCWPWAKETLGGKLVDDVVIGDWKRPWNARPDAVLPKGVPSSNFWASDPAGIEQIGCVYTAQGFEFDYAGLIWGPDLRYDPQQGWVGDPNASHDSTLKRGVRGRFLDLVKNTYRVLLTRGLKGCYVYFTDDATRNFVMSRIERKPE